MWNGIPHWVAMGIHCAAAIGETDSALIGMSLEWGYGKPRAKKQKY